ncbi:hypothetical protein E5C33_11115 [Stenotrophomonas maltophilia]|uniref:hypothetical protein n=1 Tax=Stenotrophomonas maltophilia TaxID=40324 RepID=UPI0010761E77|nr:hypothetical protein [Stenotrophomonas maltophilia]TFZ45019.1 hypothetical protein E5C33_11115 [Stenotrophomonas maltophilia]
MKVHTFALLTALASFSGSCAAAQPDLGVQCLAYAKTQYGENEDVQHELSQASPDENDTEVSRYDASVGTQRISSEVLVSIHSQQEVLGTLLCLFNDDQPIYAKYLPSN